MIEIGRRGFFVSSRKEREIAQDEVTRALSERVERRRKAFKEQEAGRNPVHESAE
jgi:hypothetical protein